MKTVSENKSKHSGINLFLCLLLLFIFTFCLPKTSSACTIAYYPDSTKTKYELNDPRNPDCPCHAAQKQAEEEYKKLQQQQSQDGTNVVNSENDPVNNNKDDSGTGNVGTKHYSKSNKRLKHMTKCVKKIKRRMGKKNNGTKKGKRRLANCFHFN